MIDRLRVRRCGVRISVPSRTSICVVNMNDFRAGQAGGGNLGLAVDLRTTMTVRIASADDVHVGRDVDATLKQLAEYVCKAWRKETRTEEQYRVEVERVAPSHVGLGSSSAFQTALWSGLNWLYGCAFSEAELRKMIANTYREVVDGLLVEGFTTGLSSFLNLYGGFARVSSDLEPVEHLRLRNWSYAVALDPRHNNVSFGAAEAEALMGRGRQLDSETQTAKLRMISVDLPESIRAGDLFRSGDVIQNLQEIGSKRAEIALHGAALYDVMHSLRAHGVAVVFMSAVGPALVAVSEWNPGKLREVMGLQGLDAIGVGMIDNVGIVLESLTSSD
jgi:predicted sugar kinase